MTSASMTPASMTIVVRPPDDAVAVEAATVVLVRRPPVEAGRRIAGTLAPAPDVRRAPERTTRAARPSLSRVLVVSPARRQWMSLRRTHVGIRTNAHTATIPNQMTALIALPTSLLPYSNLTRKRRSGR